MRNNKRYGQSISEKKAKRKAARSSTAKEKIKITKPSTTSVVSSSKSKTKSIPLSLRDSNKKIGIEDWDDALSKSSSESNSSHDHPIKDKKLKKVNSLSFNEDVLEESSTALSSTDESSFGEKKRTTVTDEKKRVTPQWQTKKSTTPIKPYSRYPPLEIIKSNKETKNKIKESVVQSPLKHSSDSKKALKNSKNYLFNGNLSDDFMNANNSSKNDKIEYHISNDVEFKQRDFQSSKSEFNRTKSNNTEAITTPKKKKTEQETSDNVSSSEVISTNTFSSKKRNTKVVVVGKNKKLKKLVTPRDKKFNSDDEDDGNLFMEDTTNVNNVQKKAIYTADDENEDNNDNDLQLSSRISETSTSEDEKQGEKEKDDKKIVSSSNKIHTDENEQGSTELISSGESTAITTISSRKKNTQNKFSKSKNDKNNSVGSKNALVHLTSMIEEKEEHNYSESQFSSSRISVASSHDDKQSYYSSIEFNTEFLLGRRSSTNNNSDKKKLSIEEFKSWSSDDNSYDSSFTTSNKKDLKADLKASLNSLSKNLSDVSKNNNKKENRKISEKEVCNLQSSFRKAASAISNNTSAKAKVITPLNNKKKQNENSKSNKSNLSNDKQESINEEKMDLTKPSVIQSIHSVDEAFPATINSLTNLCDHMQTLVATTLEDSDNNGEVRTVMKSLLECKQTLEHHAETWYQKREKVDEKLDDVLKNSLF